MIISDLDAPKDADEITSVCMRKYVALLRSFPDVEYEFIEIDGFIKHLKFLQAQSKNLLLGKVSENCGKGFRQLCPSLPSIVYNQWKIFCSRLLLLSNVHEALSCTYGALSIYLNQIIESYIISSTYDFLYQSLNKKYEDEEQQLCAYISFYQFHSQSDFGIQPELQCPQADAIRVLSKLADMKTPADKMIILKETSNAIELAIQKNIKTVFAHMDDSIECATDDIITILLYTVAQCTRCHACLAPDLRFIQEYHFVSSSTSAIGFAFCHFQIVVDWFRKRFIICREELNKSRRGSGLKPSNEGDSRELLGPKSGSVPIICPPDVKEPTCVFVDASQRNRSWIASAQARFGCLKLDSSRLDSLVKNGEITQRVDDNDTVPDLSSPTDGQYDKKNPIQSNRSQEKSHSNKIYIVSLESDHSVEPKGGLSVRCMPHDALWKRAHINCSSVGAGFYSFVISSGEVFTWGLPDSGRLGMSAAVECDSFHRVAIPRVLDFESCLGSPYHVARLSCGKNHMLAVTVEGTVLGWGDNRCGQLGFLDTVERQHSSSPRVIESLFPTSVADVACGAYHSLALSTDGHVYSWGRAADGRLGHFTESTCRHDEDLVGSPQPVFCDWSLDPCQQQIRKMSEEDMIGDSCTRQGSVIAIAAGFCHSLAVTSDGVLFSWGRGTFGCLGHGSHCHEYFPKQVLSLSLAGVRVAAVAAGLAHTLVMDSYGLVFGCGNNAHGQLAGLVPIRKDEYNYKLDRTAILSPVPIALTLDTSPSQTTGQSDASLGTQAQSPPKDDSAILNIPDDVVLVCKVSCGAVHSVAMSVHGEVLVWGGNVSVTSEAGSCKMPVSETLSQPMGRITTLGDRIAGKVQQVVSGGSDILVVTTST